MEINWIYLVTAILLLWIPAPFFFPSEAKERFVANVYGFDYSLASYLGAWQNWLDGIRGFAGTYCLVHLAVFPNAEVEHSSYIVLGTMTVILAISVIAQTAHRTEGVVFFHAPIFFLWGITLILSDWVLGIYVIIAGLCTSFMTNSVEVKLWITIVVLSIFGYFLKGINLMVALNVGLYVLPLALAYSFNNHLVALTVISEYRDDEEESDV